MCVHTHGNYIFNQQWQLKGGLDTACQVGEFGGLGKQIEWAFRMTLDSLGPACAPCSVGCSGCRVCCEADWRSRQSRSSPAATGPTHIAVRCWTCNQWAKLHNNLGQVIHMYVPLSPSSITWYQSNGGDSRWLGRWPQAWRKVISAYLRGWLNHLQVDSLSSGSSSRHNAR